MFAGRSYTPPEYASTLSEHLLLFDPFYTQYLDLDTAPRRAGLLSLAEFEHGPNVTALRALHGLPAADVPVFCSFNSAFKVRPRTFAYIVMAYIVMAYTVMAYIVIAFKDMPRTFEVWPI